MGIVELGSAASAWRVSKAGVDLVCDQGSWLEVAVLLLLPIFPYSLPLEGPNGVRGGKAQGRLPPQLVPRWLPVRYLLTILYIIIYLKYLLWVLRFCTGGLLANLTAPTNLAFLRALVELPNEFKFRLRYRAL